MRSTSSVSEDLFFQSFWIFWIFRILFDFFSPRELSTCSLGGVTSREFIFTRSQRLKMSLDVNFARFFITWKFQKFLEKFTFIQNYLFQPVRRPQLRYVYVFESDRHQDTQPNNRGGPWKTFSPLNIASRYGIDKLRFLIDWVAILLFISKEFLLLNVEFLLISKVFLLISREFLSIPNVFLKSHALSPY